MKLLFVAYKIEKNRGSEDGTGYEVARRLAKKDIELTIITRQNNIDKLENDQDFCNVRFIPAEVPKALSFYKKKSRGVILYYYLWQIFVGITISRLQKTEQFDVIHQFNFHATWAPHFIFTKAKLVWGPLTHHASIPFSFWYGNKWSYGLEVIRRFIKRLFFYCDPFLRWAARRSDVIYLGYKDYIGCYKHYSDKIRLLPQAATSFDVLGKKKIDSKFRILFVGRFVSLKGCMAALLAVEHMLLHMNDIQQSNVEFIMIGEGALSSQILYVANRINITTKARVTVISWLKQNELSVYYTEASLFLFPSFEGQGLVVVEAMAHGCPVLCLEDTGPSFLAGKAGITVEKDGFDKTISLLSMQLEYLYKEYSEKPELYRYRISSAFERAGELTWDHKADTFLRCYHE